MLCFQPLSFCTNNVDGPLELALDVARDCGFRSVELAAIDGICEHIEAEAVCPDYIRHIQSLLDARGLTCYAVSAHCDMTEPRSFARLLRKLEFAGQIGAKVVNTRCGPPERAALFWAHLPRAAATAERYGFHLNLESYGDLVGSARQAGPVLERISFPQVGYTYDPGNTFRFARGQISIEDDLRSAPAKLSYLHLKDASLRDGLIWNDPIGSGQLNWPAILERLEAVRPVLPASLEIPMTFRVRAEDLSFVFLHPSVPEVMQGIRDSLRYLSQLAEWRMEA